MKVCGTRVPMAQWFGRVGRKAGKINSWTYPCQPNDAKLCRVRHPLQQGCQYCQQQTHSSQKLHGGGHARNYSERFVCDTVRGEEDTAAQEVSVVNGDNSIGDEDPVGREADVDQVSLGDAAASFHQVLAAQ